MRISKHIRKHTVSTAYYCLSVQKIFKTILRFCSQHVILQSWFNRPIILLVFPTKLPLVRKTVDMLRLYLTVYNLWIVRGPILILIQLSTCSVSVTCWSNLFDQLLNLYSAQGRARMCVSVLKIERERVRQASISYIIKLFINN